MVKTATTAARRWARLRKPRTARRRARHHSISRSPASSAIHHVQARPATPAISEQPPAEPLVLCQVRSAGFQEVHIPATRGFRPRMPRIPGARVPVRSPSPSRPVLKLERIAVDDSVVGKPEHRRGRRNQDELRHASQPGLRPKCPSPSRTLKGANPTITAATTITTARNHPS